MKITLVNYTGRRYGRKISYEYGYDLFGNIFLEKFVGREKSTLKDKWIFEEVSSLVKVLDVEIYKREVEHYENIGLVAA